jgi:hypothetical protein
MRKELETEEEEANRLVAEEQARQNMLIEDRAAMRRSRQADSASAVPELEVRSHRIAPSRKSARRRK